MIRKSLYATFVVLVLAAITVISLVIVASCGPSANAVNIETYETITVDSDVRAEKIYGGGMCLSVVRIEDYKQGNVVYVMDGCTSDGIVVMPMEDR